MDGKSLWAAFCEKLNNDSLKDSDFTEEAKGLSFWLMGAVNAARRLRFITAPAIFYELDMKVVVMLTLPDDKYRFDFLFDGSSYKLAFMECITLPVNDIKTLPYSDFSPLPEKENELRREKEISKTVWFYLKFKELLGKEEALKIFADGKGESIGARSWVPFYEDRLAFIVYTAWTEARLYNEDVILEELLGNYSIIRLRNHIWRRMYNMTGHLRTMLSFEEYMELFEYIWTDRANKNGWNICFKYEDYDTVLTYTKPLNSYNC